jgi:thiamine transporter ThiT
MIDDKKMTFQKRSYELFFFKVQSLKIFEHSKNSEKAQYKTAALENIQMKDCLISVFARYFWHQVILRPH